MESSGADVSDRIPILVVGVGHLGKAHARVYSEIEDAELVGVVDTNLERAREIGDQLSVPAHDRLTPELLTSVRAASVVTPTRFHLGVARELIEAGVSVLVEKPMASTIEEACEIIELADRHDVTLQVGHIERFNPVILATYPHIKNPVFIECDRISPFSFRSIDISVVMDLMIHDIDLVLNLINAPVAAVDAVGARVLSEAEDLASARITFENGCVAMVKSSRVAIQRSRKMRIFCEQAYLSLDYIAKTGMRIGLKDGFNRDAIDFKKMAEMEEAQGAFPIFTQYFNIQQLPIPSTEPLRSELESFLAAVRTNRQPVVTGKHGLQAIEIAVKITNDIKRNQEDYRRRRERYQSEDDSEPKSSPSNVFEN